MERILVIGSPGAGKSHFSRALSAATGLPLYHLDMLYWNERGESCTREELVSRLLPILEGERWIIDGNFSATFPLRLSYATCVILIDVDFEVCEDGIRSRVDTVRDDIPFVESEPREELIEAARRYRTYTLPKMLDALKQHPRVKLLRFDTRENANNYLQSIITGGSYV